MFESIKRQWREARGEGLRCEFEDAILRLNGLDPEVNARASLTLAKALHEVETQHGPLTNISNDGKIRLAKQIRQAAKQKFTFDMGSGYGLALLSMHLESQTVPGDHGRFVQTAMQDFVKAALQVEQSAHPEAESTSPASRCLSEADIEALETMFCLHPETASLLDRAASDRAAYAEIEGVLREAFQDEAFVAFSLEAARSLRQAMAHEPTDAYYLARRSVESFRFLGATSPRDCLAMMLGYELDDREWLGASLRTMREQFERAWRDDSSFESPTLEWLKGTTSRQYLVYLRRQHRGG